MSARNPWAVVKFIAYMIWAVGSFGWLFFFGPWVLKHEGPGPGHSATFFIGTLWAGSFFVYLINRRQP
jgi:hypothetical protein